MVDDVDMK
jgi:P-type Ca2+ transporter type 2B